MLYSVEKMFLLYFGVQTACGKSIVKHAVDHDLPRGSDTQLLSTLILIGGLKLN